MVMREPITVGFINDGQEVDYPISDVPRLAEQCSILTGIELTENMADQLPNWNVYQNFQTDNDNSFGIALRKEISFTVEEVLHPQMLVPWDSGRAQDNQALMLHVTYQGAPGSILTTHRPIKMANDKRPEFDASLSKLFAKELAAGRWVICGIDCNSGNPPLPTGATWSPASDGSIVGFISAGNVTVIGFTGMQNRAEHPPVVGIFKVPVSNQT